MRGVYATVIGSFFSESGSSPHARGLHHNDLREGEVQGIIPACAGFTDGNFIIYWALTDHPRMRGVYDAGEYLDMAVGRIIPACAGFTSRARPRRVRSPDHPRMRGVYR